jgi:hypothetical protein
MVGMVEMVYKSGYKWVYPLLRGNICIVYIILYIYIYSILYSIIYFSMRYFISCSFIDWIWFIDWITNPVY